MKKGVTIGFLTGMFLLSYPKCLYAYVDPGIIGTAFQLVYFLVFGVLLAWLVKPFTYLKRLFQKGKDRSADGASPAESDDTKSRE